MVRESQKRKQRKRGPWAQVTEHESDLPDQRCPDTLPTTTWGRISSFPPIPGAELRNIPTIDRAKAVEKVCSLDPVILAQCGSCKRWSDLDPVPLAWGSCMPSLHTDVSQAPSAPMFFSTLSRSPIVHYRTPVLPAGSPFGATAFAFSQFPAPSSNERSCVSITYTQCRVTAYCMHDGTFQRANSPSRVGSTVPTRVLPVSACVPLSEPFLFLARQPHSDSGIRPEKRARPGNASRFNTHTSTGTETRERQHRMPDPDNAGTRLSSHTMKLAAG
ncbi:hypothetical protein MYCTH_94018 [Thermothelomyces thermophilus ATCC 42464]|uniref:Uncharacterized protein n=1 Tax=Thermothelomyces thermophilus (strain ATCC 42464 / BCRC 31852 / DSM 1799) TaxID=573729 RepID=G2QEH2_THET4|nr:uncharacterized protein MYCTH_94018 [Thermothelomyces thermophilus ATCC 42464]AEO57755.1 hypothetical protein MYCTH_94018 [Thermothelomyces thermophilus ATCC 42464]